MYFFIFVIEQGQLEFLLQHMYGKVKTNKQTFTSVAKHPDWLHPGNQCIDEVTADVTAGQNKSSEQKIALQYACAPVGFEV